MASGRRSDCISVAKSKCLHFLAYRSPRTTGIDRNVEIMPLSPGYGP